MCPETYRLYDNFPRHHDNRLMEDSKSLSLGNSPPRSVGRVHLTIPSDEGLRRKDESLVLVPLHSFLSEK